jgi:hypothetical protein
MATIGIRAPLVYASAPPVHLREAASQTFKKGDLVKVVAGLVTAATTPATDVQLLIAAQDASNNAVAGAVRCACYRLTDDVTIEMNLFHATPASAVWAFTDIGTGYEWVINSGALCLNKAGVTNVRFKVMEVGQNQNPDYGSTTSDTYPRVLVKPIVGAAGAASNFY